MEDFKPRDQHFGQSRHDKDGLEQAAGAIDQGPSIGTPGDPPDADRDSTSEIDKALGTSSTSTSVYFATDMRRRKSSG